MDDTGWNHGIRSMLRDQNGGYVEIGPGLADSEYGSHMGRLFDFMYQKAAEIRENPEEPASGYLRLALQCAIEEAKSVNNLYMEHPVPHVDEWTRHIQQFENCGSVVDLITDLAETVCRDEYVGAEAAELNRQVRKSLREASVPKSVMIHPDSQKPQIRIYEYDQVRDRLFKGQGEAEAA